MLFLLDVLRGHVGGPQQYFLTVAPAAFLGRYFCMFFTAGVPGPQSLPPVLYLLLVLSNHRLVLIALCFQRPRSRSGVLVSRSVASSGWDRKSLACIAFVAIPSFLQTFESWYIGDRRRREAEECEYFLTSLSTSSARFHRSDCVDVMLYTNCKRGVCEVI